MILTEHCAQLDRTNTCRMISLRDSHGSPCDPYSPGQRHPGHPTRSMHTRIDQLAAEACPYGPPLGTESLSLSVHFY
jgi:hypothetical protein